MEVRASEKRQSIFWLLGGNMDEKTRNAIKDRIYELGINYSTVALDLGFEPNQISDWLRGKKNPLMKNFYALLDAVGLEIEIKRKPNFDYELEPR